MANTEIELGQSHTLVNDQGHTFENEAGSDVLHGFYRDRARFHQNPDAWVISVNGDNGVIDAGRHLIPGKILLRNGQQEVMLILDGQTGELQQAGDIRTNGDVLVLRNAKVVIRLDGDEGDLFLRGGTPDESSIWLQSSEGKAVLGRNIRLEGDVGKATLGKPTAGGAPGANGAMALNNHAGETRVMLSGGEGNGQFHGRVSVGTGDTFPEKLHVEGKTVVAGDQAELLVAGNASIGTSTTHRESLHVAGQTVITSGATVGADTAHSEKLYVEGNARIAGQGASLQVEGPTTITALGGPQDPSLKVKGPTIVEGAAAPAPQPGGPPLTDFNVRGDSRLAGTLEVAKNVDVGTLLDAQNGRIIQVMDKQHAGAAARVSGNTHVGMAANLSDGDVVYWDPQHDLAFCTRARGDGASSNTDREVMKATRDGKLIVGEIELDGNENEICMPNADFAEDFEAGQEDLEPGTVVVIENEGKLARSSDAYDKRVAGVISGAGRYRPGIILDRQQGARGSRVPVALMGKVFCKVDADESPIEVGDLLTTASIPGHAMRATDQARAFGAVIGKALRALPSGQGLIPVLVGLQ